MEAQKETLEERLHRLENGSEPREGCSHPVPPTLSFDAVPDVDALLAEAPSMERGGVVCADSYRGGSEPADR